MAKKDSRAKRAEKGKAKVPQARESKQRTAGAKTGSVSGTSSAARSAVCKDTERKSAIYPTGEKPDATATSLSPRPTTSGHTTGGNAPSTEDTGTGTTRKTHLTPQQLEEFRKLLLELRDRLVDGINFLARENLSSSQREASGDLSSYGIHIADQGTDSFDREFALNVVSNEQELLYEIDEALNRIEMGTYGICELTGRPIEIERLRAVPYTRFCLAAQAELEKGKRRYRTMGAASSITHSEG